jgi:hypothetical protein
MAQYSFKVSQNSSADSEVIGERDGHDDTKSPPCIIMRNIQINV